MTTAGYDRWYDTRFGAWVERRESELLLKLLSPKPGDSLLDAGCGTGRFTRFFARQTNGPVTGVDQDETRILYARNHVAARETYQMADLRHLPFADNAFDDTICVAAHRSTRPSGATNSTSPVIVSTNAAQNRAKETVLRSMATPLMRSGPLC